jgi:hypothetical protein
MILVNIFIVVVLIGILGLILPKRLCQKISSDVHIFKIISFIMMCIAICGIVVTVLVMFIRAILLIFCITYGEMCLIVF